MGKKRIYVALCLIALAMLGICFFYLKKTGWGMTGDKAWNELLDLDKNVTLEQLEAKGYINVTGCLDEENETISEFIDNAGNRRPAVLRLTSNENDDLCAKILLYDKDYNFIQMWTMYPNRQQAVAPGKCFSTDVVSSDKDGVVTVTLKISRIQRFRQKKYCRMKCFINGKNKIVKKLTKQLVFFMLCDRIKKQLNNERKKQFEEEKSKL